MKVVSFSIFKGGTGKTTTSVNTAAALVNKGKRVLVVDLDQQASATRYLDLDPEQSPHLYNVFMGAKPAQLAIRKTRFKIDVLASHVLLAAIEEALEPGDELKLSDFLKPLKPSNDFILSHDVHTLDTYSHLLPSFQVDAVNMRDKLLGD